MAESRSSVPPRREHLVNEYHGASDAAFDAIGQMEMFSFHARKAKASKDRREEEQLWEAANRNLVNALKHREYELKCRKLEYSLYKQHMTNLEKAAQKSVMAYCSRRLHRLREYDQDYLRLKGSIVRADIRIGELQQMYSEQLQDKEDAQYRSRLNGNRPAHVTSFGNGWDRGYGGRPQANNDAYLLKKMEYSLAYLQKRIKELRESKEDAREKWASIKERDEEFRMFWKPHDDHARALMAQLDAERRNPPVDGSQQNTELEEGEEPSTWEEDFEMALAGTSAPSHNLLSPAPGAEVKATTSQYAGMCLKDDHQGMDSGYESAMASVAGSSAAAVPADNVEGPQTGWEEARENISAEASWQAAYDAVGVSASSDPTSGSLAYETGSKATRVEIQDL